MAKNVREQTRAPKTARVEHSIIPPKYQHLAAIVFIYASLLIFFHSIIFDTKTYQSADTIAAHSWDTFRNDSQTQGVIPLWNPYIFCGMPGFASLTYPIDRAYDFSTFLWEKVVRENIISHLFFEDGRSGAWALYYLVYGIGLYLFAYHRLKNKPLALIVSLMGMYATYIALLIMMGHATKLAVLAWFPYVFLITDKLRERFNILLAAGLIIAVRLLLEPGHVQFIFYIYLALGCYLGYFLLRGLIKKEPWKGVLISGATLVLATGIAFLMGADQHFSTLEYNPYSIRGANPIQNTASTAQTKTVEGGLDYDYATSYSFSPGELMTFFVPSWYGFGPLSYQGPLTGNQLQRLYFYWGQQPIVDGPQYMGIVVIILAFVGVYRFRKDPFVQFLAGLIVFALFISFGRDLPFVYDLMYRYFPMFNKFRAPVLILMLVQFCTPILAGYGIASFITERKNSLNAGQQKVWKYTFGILMIGLVLSLFGSSLLKEIHSSFFPLQEIGKALSRSYGQLDPTVVGMFYDYVFSLVTSDVLIAFILLIIVFGSLYLYQKNKVRSTVLYGIILTAVLFDLWRVAWKPSEPRDKQEGNLAFSTPEFVKVLLQDTTQYRILKFENGQPKYDNTLAYWRIQNAYGYQGAKMRRYQDMMDVCNMGNPLVWQLMNVKYLISNTNDSSAALVSMYKSREANVYGFRGWLPRVFFVNRCEVADDKGTLNRIASMSFDPREIAFVPEKITSQIDPPLQNAEARIVRSGTQEFEVQATATGNNLLFLSETYYPKGWKAYVDGKETEILRLDYLFRGIVIPQGKHTIHVKFEPASFTLGKTISLITNLIILVGIILLLLRRFLLQRGKVAITK